MAEYNGYPSWNAWNVSLWINNNEALYREAVAVVNRVGEAKAARFLARDWEGMTTPDGGKFNHRAIRLAIRGICD